VAAKHDIRKVEPHLIEVLDKAGERVQVEVDRVYDTDKGARLVGKKGTYRTTADHTLWEAV
jgi:hypothetical protein